MTASTLFWGSAFLAFSPTASLLFLVAYQKAQLIIVVTTSAFAFLLSALLASLVWWIFDLIGLNNPLLIIIPGVCSQFVMRCVFVVMYHKVEKVIESSIARHEEQQNRQQHRTTANGQQQQTPPEISESARLRLELNDWSCGLAAGTGFGGMHAVLLYGTLLASEAGSLGTLYQPACPAIPALVVSALNAFFFSVLDVLWMLFTFFGIRRRHSDLSSDDSNDISCASGWGCYFGNTNRGGRIALAVCVISHTLATLSTMPNGMAGGCIVSLPLLGVTVIATCVAFVCGVSKIYLPTSQRRRASGDTHDD